MRYLLTFILLFPLTLHAQEGEQNDSIPDIQAAIQAATDGDIDAQCFLGLVYSVGQYGVEQNYQQAIHWFSLAAKAGEPSAQYNLSLFYIEGFGVEPDTIQAQKWYDLALAQNPDLPPLIVERPATNDEVDLTLPEVDEKKKGRKAEKLRAKANTKVQELIAKYRPRAEAGDAIAQYNMGVLYNEGYGDERNYKEAFKWFRMAAEQGDPDAQNNLGIMYYEGQGVGKNYSQAFHWYSLAAEQEHVAAQYNIGIMYEQGIGTDKDRAKAKQWYKKAADQGYEPAKRRMENL